jgi:hypothetical protein
MIDINRVLLRSIFLTKLYLNEKLPITTSFHKRILAWK